MDRKQKLASEILEEYIKNFEIKHNLKIKKPKSKTRTKIESNINTDPTFKIEKVIDNLSSKVKSYKNEINLGNLYINEPIKKYASDLSIGGSETSNFSKSSSSTKSECYQNEDPLLKSLAKFQELSKKLEVDNNKNPTFYDHIVTNGVAIGTNQNPSYVENIESFIQDCMKITNELPLLKLQ